MNTLGRWAMHVLFGTAAGLLIGYSLGWLGFFFVWIVLG